MISTRKYTCVAGILPSICCASSSRASPFSFLGSFADDDDVQVHTFTINAPSTATLETFSYGDGTNGSGQSGLCGDSALTVNNLQAGTYTAAYTEFFNVPNGLSLPDGFLEEGEGNFTRPQLCGTTGGLFDAGCNQRSEN